MEFGGSWFVVRGSWFVVVVFYVPTVLYCTTTVEIYACVSANILYFTFGVRTNNLAVLPARSTAVSTTATNKL